MSSNFNLIAISVGNTRTQIGRFEDGRFAESQRFGDEELAEITRCVTGWWPMIGDKPPAAIALASVNDPLANRIAADLEGQLALDIYRVGFDLPVPIGRQLDPGTITGVDRLLNAAAAYDIVQQACIVVDAGSAVTVDFVDGEGTFHGGAIAPGGEMQLRALHDHTAALPLIEFREPNRAEAIGRSTAQAMLSGVFHGIRGMVWKLAERYAAEYGAYPIIVATGGDAEVLFAEDELIDRCVPNLTLMGIAAAVRHALASEDTDRSEPRRGDPDLGDRIT